LQGIAGDRLRSRTAELTRILGIESFIERRQGFLAGQRIKWRWRVLWFTTPAIIVLR